MMQLTPAVRGSHLRLAAAALVALLATTGVAGGVDSVAGTAPGMFRAHRYRIIGRLRLGLFSVTRDGVGSARMTWRSDGPQRVLTFLAGSDPEHAPRGLNRWAYVREEVPASGAAEVFTARTIDDDEAGLDASSGDGPSFALSCESLRGPDLLDAQTTVRAAGVTYRMFDELLDSVPDTAAWKTARTQPPAGTAAGFLTALQDALRRVNRGDVDPRVSIPYVYSTTLYDLVVRSSEPLGPTRIDTRLFSRLTRTEFAVRNRASAEMTKFAVTHVPEREGASLPVQVFYRPSFWMGIELRLDENADVPVDPDADPTVRARIRAVCARGAALLQQ